MNVLRAVSVPNWMRNGSVFESYEVALTFDELMILTSDLNDRSRRLLYGEGARPQYETSTRAIDCKQLADQALDLDDRLIAWVSRKTDEWKFDELILETKEIGASEEPMNFAPLVGHQYTSDVHAAVWNRWRAVRLVVNDIRFRALQQHRYLSGVDTDGPLHQTRAIIQKMADEISATIPFHFNRQAVQHGSSIQSSAIEDKRPHGTPSVHPHMAHWMAWPLLIAATTAEIPSHQRRWLCEQLHVAGRTLGDGTLLSMANIELVPLADRIPSDCLSSSIWQRNR